MRANEQQTVWYVLTQTRNKKNEERTALGPTETTADSMMRRLFSCSHYDSCLFYAAKRLWPRFTCENCRLVDQE